MPCRVYTLPLDHLIDHEVDLSVFGARYHVVMMALSADTQPHFTTIADFICPEEVTRLFRNILF